MKTSTAGLREIEAVRLQGHYLDRDDEDIQEARTQLLRKLSSASPGTVVRLDLSEARLRSSCVAEILGPALEGVVRGKYEGRYVVVLDEGDRHSFEMDAALKKESDLRGEKLVSVRRTDERTVELLGPVDSQVDRTYEFVRRQCDRPEGATARAYVKEDPGISIQAASNRLTKAAKMGLIHAAERVPVPGGGSQRRYVPVQ